MIMRRALIGTSGYNYRDWKGKFYPEKLPQKGWLSFYAKHFSTVEINATFYGSFKRTTFEKWASQTPHDFAFTLKGTRFLTHIKRLKDPEEPIDRFFSEAKGLGEKFNCCLWQFPKNFTYKDETAERLRYFLKLLPIDVRQVFEFRNTSWFRDEVFRLLNTHHAGFVMNDSSVYPENAMVTDSIVYIRFHGPGKLYASSYTDEQLQEWADKIRGYLKRYDVYCYFNNDYGARAIVDSEKLQHYVTR
jgi:uncharacterized protein YecE (DUF72 family)